MTEQLNSGKTTTKIPDKTRGHRVVLLCGAGWTVVVVLALWWLLRANTPSVVIVREGEALQPWNPEKFHAFFKSDSGFLRVYPWVLFGPYVALLAMYFPLEHGRLRWGVPINLAACAAFLVAAHAIDARTGTGLANVTVIRAQGGTGPDSGSASTNSLKIEVSGLRSGDLQQEQTFIGIASQARSNAQMPGADIGKWRDLPDSSITNLLARGVLPFGPGLPPHGPPGFAILPRVLDLVAYVAIVGLAHWVHFYRRFREREHRAVFLESSLANARLNALRAQLQPHFLFNSLNAIVTLLRRDPRLAEATLMSLSDLLRLALSQSEKQEVPLREEMELVQRYLDIQQTRFGDKLRVEEEIEPAALDCLVPSLLLQPLVENAIRHGIEPAENSGKVRLTAHRRNGWLALTVEDNGVGLPRAAIDLPPATVTDATVNGDSHALAPAAPLRVNTSVGGTGIGLANLRSRLQVLYGDQHKLDLSPRAEGGVIVDIEIPWRTVAPTESSNASGHS
ncbi:MAG TPA: sensor histidine kinase [Verrucomicrobiae bacterium]|nr:sensor histidine kinase [Verrucomicrobiae bacterium]